jgi:hypothetical protein
VKRETKRETVKRQIFFRNKTIEGEVTMPHHLRARHTIRVRLLSEPCLWCWEIRDEANGELIENSWTSEWRGYESREKAREAGEARLAMLALGRSAAGTLPAGRPGTQRVAARRQPLRQAG